MKHLFGFVVFAAFFVTAITTAVISTEKWAAKSQSVYSHELQTVQHDGHMWITTRHGTPLRFLHHPDCQCKIMKEEGNDTD